MITLFLNNLMPFLFLPGMQKLSPYPFGVPHFPPGLCQGFQSYSEYSDTEDGPSMGSRARLYAGQGISAEAPNSGLAYLSVDLHLIWSERHFWSRGFLYSTYASLEEETNSVASLPGWNTGPWVSLSTRAKEILSTWDFIHSRTLP